MNLETLKCVGGATGLEPARGDPTGEQPLIGPDHEMGAAGKTRNGGKRPLRRSGFTDEDLAHDALGAKRARQESTSLSSVMRSSSVTPGFRVNMYAPGAIDSETERRWAWT